MKKPAQVEQGRTVQPKPDTAVRPNKVGGRTGRFSAEKTTPETPTSLENTEGLEKLSGLESSRPFTFNYDTKGEQCEDVSLLPVNSAGLAEEIRNGDIDWKRALVINELLNRKVV